MRSALIIAVMFLSLIIEPGWADQTESEPNSNKTQANGPINFNEILTGGLPGAFGSDNSPYEDYWSFSAKKNHQYQFAAVPLNSSIPFPLDIDLDLEDAGGNIIARAVAGEDNQNETLNWTAPADGEYYLVVYEGTGLPNGAASYEVNCTRIAPVDSNAPTYSTGATGGIIAAQRINNNEGALLTWQLAQDDTTIAPGMKYDVYYNTNRDAVFSSGVKQTFVGTAMGEVNGLSVAQTYYIGVRARDEAGNRENNTKIIAVSPLTAAANWSLYK